MYTLHYDRQNYRQSGSLLMGMYNSALKSQLNKRGVDFSHFDLTEGMPEILDLDPITHLRRLNEEFLCLAPEVQKEIREANYTHFNKSTRRTGSLKRSPIL